MTEVMDDGKKGNKSKFDISSKLFKGGSLLNLINGGVMKDGKVGRYDVKILFKKLKVITWMQVLKQIFTNLQLFVINFFF